MQVIKINPLNGLMDGFSLQMLEGSFQLGKLLMVKRSLSNSEILIYQKKCREYEWEDVSCLGQILSFDLNRWKAKSWVVLARLVHVLQFKIAIEHIGMIFISAIVQWSRHRSNQSSEIELKHHYRKNTHIRINNGNTVLIIILPRIPKKLLLK